MLVKGSDGIISHVERKSRYLIAAKFPNKIARSLTTESIKAFWRIPKVMKKSYTAVNGQIIYKAFCPANQTIFWDTTVQDNFCKML